MRGFSDEERKRIREQLIRTGRELLLTYGPQKTTVKDITDQVGIAKPTFYQFFDAKADIYLLILQRELDEFVERVRSELDGIEDARIGLERLFRCYAELADENPIIQQMVIQNNHQEFFHNVSTSTLETVQREEMAKLAVLIEDLKSQSNGPLTDIDVATVLSLMAGTIGLLAVHKDDFEEYEAELTEYDEGMYNRLQNVLISSLARGLTIADPSD
ncbi:TetR/AcrR family transcriptional regulator [Halocatena halophila]|uniref:TetR/AcrR family transcriptional regulator n=1 Tax=Halocatena halophila TaxID=2814576 RepID=UPI002ED189C4